MFLDNLSLVAFSFVLAYFLYLLIGGGLVVPGLS